MKKLFLVLMFFSLFVTGVAVVSAAGAPPADWVLHEEVSPAKNLVLGVTRLGRTAIIQGLEERVLVSFAFGKAGSDNPQYVSGVRYTNFRLALEYEGEAALRGLRMDVRHPDLSVTSFSAEGEDDDGVFFLRNQAIEPISKGFLQVEFLGTIQGTGKIHYTLEYDVVDAFGHALQRTGTPKGTVLVRQKTWMVSTTGGLLVALDKALSGDEIIVEKGVYNLTSSGTPTPASGITIQGSGREETLVLLSHPITAESLTLSGLSLFQTTAGAAVVSRYLIMQEAAIWSSHWGLRLQGGVGSFVLQDNVFWGGGILLQVSQSKAGAQVVENNFFTGSGGCGVDISIDVVFGNLPESERLSAFEEFKAALQEQNIFYNKEVCDAVVIG